MEGRDWEERPPLSEPEWWFVIGRLCQSWIGHKNTMFKHKCTWYQSALGRGSMIDFVIVSSDLRPYVLGTRVKRGAELSTDPSGCESGQVEGEAPGQTWLAQTCSAGELGTLGWAPVQFTPPAGLL